MRKRLCFFLLFLLSAASIFAEKNYTSEKVVFLPQDFYVGDPVEMRVIIKPEPGVEVLEPEKFPQQYWIMIESADVIRDQDEYELRIRFRSYAPGIRTLPPLQFGDILLKDLRLQTKSVLEDYPSGFEPVFGQLLLPGTNYYIAIIVGVVFILPILLIIFWKKIKKAIEDYIQERSRRKPFRQLQKVLKDLEDNINTRKGNDFYTLLVSELRSYLTARGSVDYSAATSREAAAGMLNDFSGAGDCRQIAELFSFADQVKFGGRRVMMKKREQDLNHIKDAVVRIETWYFDEEEQHAGI